MKRTCDLIFALILAIIFFIPLIFIYIVIVINSVESPIYWSNRIGKDNKVFRMAKFRSMKINAPEIATHELKNPNIWLTSLGSFLRSTSIDELPQIFNILKGEMSFVGPRPALFNQYDLIEMRTKKNIHRLVPGITGWAQINGRDELSIIDKVFYDQYYLKNKSFFLDLKILWLTIIKVLTSDGVK